jgi:hypothetical protein
MFAQPDETSQRQHSSAHRIRLWSSTPPPKHRLTILISDRISVFIAHKLPRRTSTAMKACQEWMRMPSEKTNDAQP